MLDLQTTLKVADDGTITVALPEALRGQDVSVRIKVQLSEEGAWIGVPRIEQRFHHGLLRARNVPQSANLKRSA